MKIILTKKQLDKISEQISEKPKRKRRTSLEIQKEKEEWEKGYREKFFKVKNKLQEVIDNVVIPEFNSQGRNIKIVSSEIDDLVLNVGRNLANIYPKIKFTSKDQEYENYLKKNGFFPYFLLSPFYNLLREKLNNVYKNERIGVSQENMNYEYIPYQK